MTTNTGGPAFPTGTGGNTPYSNGMALRDFFAAKASEEDIKYWMPMGVMVTKVRAVEAGFKSIYEEPGMYSREQARYRFADAMLKEREQK